MGEEQDYKSRLGNRCEHVRYENFSIFSADRSETNRYGGNTLPFCVPVITGINHFLFAYLEGHQ